MPPSRLLNRYRRDESGATAIEYGLIAAMIASVLVAIFSTGEATEALYNSLLAISDAITGDGG
jgi:pilus assembly protein Flp/PilA